MNWAELIKKLVEDLRLSEPQIAEKSGLTYTAINKIRIGKTKNPHPSTIKQLEDGLNIKINNSDPKNISYNKIVNEQKKFKDQISVYDYPLISEVYAGEPNKMNIEYSGLYEPFTYHKKNHHCFALKVNGQSMETTLKDGDIVLVDMNLEPLEGDLVAVKLNNGNQYIKRFKNLNYAFIQLSSDNSDYGVRLIDKNDIEVIYPVVQIVFNLKNGERKP